MQKNPAAPQSAASTAIHILMSMNTTKNPATADTNMNTPAAIPPDATAPSAGKAAAVPADTTTEAIKPAKKT